MSDFSHMQIAIWNVSQTEPRRLMHGSVAYEKNLEEWIERDPSIIQNDLIIIGRQIHLDAGILDLLGIDKLGRWIVIELKRGNVRRETVTQAIDYAACIDDLSSDALMGIASNYLTRRGLSLETLFRNYGLDDSILEERDILIYVVGTGRDTDLERMTRQLTFKGNSITVVTFEIFENNLGDRLIVRKLSELDMMPTSVSKSNIVDKTPPSQKVELQQLFATADEKGIGEGFRLLYDVATRNGLYPRLYKWSIMYTPPQHKGRCALVAWVNPVQRKLQVYAVAETIAEYYPISEQEVINIIGTSDRRLMTLLEVKELEQQLDQLFEVIKSNQ